MNDFSFSVPQNVIAGRGSITDYEGGGKVPGDIVPLVAIPTTAGTGSETTAFSVITDHSRNYKLTVFSCKVIPSYAILDADLITTVPAPTAAACDMDAMADDAMKSGNIAVNPRASAKRDILDLYRKAL